MNANKRRERQIAFCKKCLNRKMDMKQGLICNLTGEKADFIDNCPDFNNDKEARNLILDGKKAINRDEIKHGLSSKTIDELKKEQRFDTAIILGTIVGLLAAILSIFINISILFNIEPILIAIVVGLTIRNVGKGIDRKFGIWGAIIALVSVFTSNFFCVIVFIITTKTVSFSEALSRFDYSHFTEIVIGGFGFMNLVLCSIVAFIGYKFSFRKITEKKLFELRAKE